MARSRLASRLLAFAFVAGVAFLSMFVWLTHGDRRSHADGVIPDWPARGQLAHDSSFVDASLQTWDTSSGGHHALRAVLYAGDDRIGPVAVLLATDRSGQLRLGIVVGESTGSVQPAVPPTTLLVDRPVDATLHAVAAIHPTHSPGRERILIVVTDPVLNSMRVDDVRGTVNSDTLVDGLDFVTLAADDPAPKKLTVYGKDGVSFDAAVG